MASPPDSGLRAPGPGPQAVGLAPTALCGLAWILILAVVVGCGPDDNPMGINVSFDPSEIAGATGTTGSSGGGGVGAPTVTSISPEVGTTTGANVLVVSGSNFSASTTVTFGTVAGTVTFVNATTLNVVVPQNATATDVAVTAANGTSLATNRPTYTYVPAPFAYNTITDGVGTFLGAGRIRTGNFTADTNLDIAYIDNSTEVSIAIGNGAGLLTETTFGTVIPFAGTIVTGIAVGRINNADGIGVADGNQVHLIFRGAGAAIDTIASNTVANASEDILFDPDPLATPPRFYLTKIPGLVERYSYDNAGTIALLGQVTGISGGNLGEIAVGTRDNLNAVLVTDNPNPNVRLVRTTDQQVTTFPTQLTGTQRAAANQGEDAINVWGNPANGTLHVVAEDTGTTVIPLPLNAGGPISGLAVGDVNGDGRPDAVVTEQLATNGRILAFLNGGFQGARLRFSNATQVSSRSFASPKELQLGFFNADTQLDIVLFTDGAGTRLRVLSTP